MKNFTCPSSIQIVGRVSHAKDGSVLIYTTFAVVLILAICILAVDFGRVSVARAELKTAADAAVRAGGMRMLEGASLNQVMQAASQIISNNRVDGNNVTVRTGSVRIGVYLPATKQFFVTNDPNIANAVSVTLEHRFSESAIPLSFVPIFNGGDTVVRTESMIMISDVPGNFNVQQFTTTTPASQTNTPATTQTQTTTNNSSTSTASQTNQSNSNASTTTNNNSTHNSTHNSSTRTNTNTNTTARTTSNTNNRNTPTNTNRNTATNTNRNTTTNTHTTTNRNTTQNNSNSASNNTNHSSTNTQNNSSANSSHQNNNSSSSTTTTNTPATSTSTPASSTTVTVVTQTPGNGRRLITIK